MCRPTSSAATVERRPDPRAVPRSCPAPARSRRLSRTGEDPASGSLDDGRGVDDHMLVLVDRDREAVHPPGSRPRQVLADHVVLTSMAWAPEAGRGPRRIAVPDLAAEVRALLEERAETALELCHVEASVQEILHGAFRQEILHRPGVDGPPEPDRRLGVQD